VPYGNILKIKIRLQLLNGELKGLSRKLIFKYLVLFLIENGYFENPKWGMLYGTVTSSANFFHDVIFLLERII